MAPTADNRVFVDTNVLLAATDRSRKDHPDALEFLEEGRRGGLRLFATAQIFREYLVVSTRPPEGNGLGLSPENAVENVRCFQKILQILPEDKETALRLLHLVDRHSLKEKRIHDANLLAGMSRHGLRKLKTYNPSDFQGFPDIELVD